MWPPALPADAMDVGRDHWARRPQGRDPGAPWPLRAVNTKQGGHARSVPYCHILLYNNPAGMKREIFATGEGEPNRVRPLRDLVLHATTKYRSLPLRGRDRSSGSEMTESFLIPNS